MMMPRLFRNRRHAGTDNAMKAAAYPAQPSPSVCAVTHAFSPTAFFPMCFVIMRAARENSSTMMTSTAAEKFAICSEWGFSDPSVRITQIWSASVSPGRNGLSGQVLLAGFQLFQLMTVLWPAV